MKKNELTYRIHRIAELMQRVEEESLRLNFGITFSQFRMLMAINDSVCQKDIAQYWNITESAVSRQIEYLVQNRLLKRSVDNENRRKNTLEVTDKGKKKLESALEFIDSRYDKIYSQFSEEDLDKVNTVLKKIYSDLGGVDNENSSCTN